METVEVVIRIPKKLLDETMAIWNSMFGSTMLNETDIAIVSGTILPQGHGRLIDADAINIHDVSPTYGMEVYGVTQDDIEYEPTVIEADREVQDEK